MNKGHKQFSISVDLFCQVDMLSDRMAGILFKKIYHYVNNEPLEKMNPIVKIVYDRAIRHIEEQWAKKAFAPGAAHFNYKGGVTPINRSIRNSNDMKSWRREVFIRDGFTCQHCNQKGGIIHAHHIKEFSKFPELRFELNNGLTLCKKCHNKIHSKKQIQNG